MTPSEIRSMPTAIITDAGRRLHTPLPWSVGDPDPKSCYHGHPELIFGVGGESVADCCRGTRENGRANAELIVRAVNCHDDLLRACLMAVQFVRFLSEGVRAPDMPNVIAELEATIAKAEGRS